MSSIILTGANGALGTVVTDHMLSQGYRVYAAVGSSRPGDLKDSENLVYRPVNLIDEQEADVFVASVIENAGELDAAVLLVGGFRFGKLVDTSKGDLEKIIDLNFYSAYNMVRPLMKYFLGRKEGGRFILVGSRPGLDSATGKDFIGYALSKSMIFKLAELINATGKSNNVDAIVLVPSTIDTEANRKDMPDADFTRWVKPETIARTISFYLSPDGRNIKEGIVKVYNRA